MQLAVSRVTRLTDRVIELDLTSAAGEPLPAWRPGAHIDLVLENSFVRQYSLCSDPADVASYRVGVLLQDSSRGGSRWIHDNLKPGDLVTARGPRNHFELEDAPCYRFVAGGIGITPLLPMMETADAEGKPFTSLYGGRSIGAMPYLDRVGRFGDRLKVVAEDVSGRLDLDAFLARPQPGELVYCCGPESLLTAVQERCRTWPASSLRVERFAGEGVPDAVRADDGGFDVYLRQAGTTAHVGPTQTLLDVLETLGADVLSDCREGICGTCEVTVVTGDVDHRDSVLSERERQRGDVMMACVSRASSPSLTLDL